MSPQKQFRVLQKELDGLGYLTSIVRIFTNKKYEVVVNGEIKKSYKQRKSAKLFINKLYQKAKHNN